MSDDADAERSLAPEMDSLLLDVMLGKLAVYLRAAGYDAAYAGERDIEADDRLLAVAAEEGRTLLTRDVRLADRADDAVLLTERDPIEQLRELHEMGAEIAPEETPTRCGRCNGRLDAVADGESTPEYAPPTADIDCFRCRDCGQVFWKGSHWKRMKETLRAL